ncbi:MAG: hypothetical protein ACXACU_02540 [Candidatus Hodarchaeales archaeon]
MEIEFNGISEEILQDICNNHGVSADFFPLAKRDALCPREQGKTFGDGEAYYIAEESCWHGYFLCGNFNCGRTSRRRSMVGGPSRISRGTKKSGRRSSGCNGSGVDCSGTNCDAGNDSLGAIILIFVIIAAIILLIALAPYLFTGIVILIELGLAVILGLFDIITFGIFRRKFKRVLVYFSSTPSDEKLNTLIRDVASQGGLPRRFDYAYFTNGWWILRTGAYLFIPTLIAMILVLWLQPENGALFRIPIIAFFLSILFVWFGNFLVSNKAKEIASTS